MYKVNDKVRALHDIIDGDDVVCAREGDEGVILDIIEDEPDCPAGAAYDVLWPHMITITSATEMAPWESQPN